MDGTGKAAAPPATSPAPPHACKPLPAQTGNRSACSDSRTQTDLKSHSAPEKVRSDKRAAGRQECVGPGSSSQNHECTPMKTDPGRKARIDRNFRLRLPRTKLDAALGSFASAFVCIRVHSWLINLPRLSTAAPSSAPPDNLRPLG
jgi:hypothetical protein